MFDILLQPLAGVLPVQHEDVTIATDHVFGVVSGGIGSDSTQSIGVIDTPGVPPPNKIGVFDPPPMKIGATDGGPLPPRPTK